MTNANLNYIQFAPVHFTGSQCENSHATAENQAFSKQIAIAITMGLIRILQHMVTHTVCVGVIMRLLTILCDVGRGCARRYLFIR